jgi:hypothetical protein
MSKTTPTMSTPILVVNVLLCLVTGFWVLPFGIYILMMWSQKQKPNLALVALHTILSTMTVFWWLVAIIIYYVYKKK